MIRIILCEGETDLTLLGLYLEKVCGWKYDKQPTWKIKVPQTFPLGNEKSENYVKGEEVLKICCVGGKDCFGLFFRRYIKRIIESSQNKEKDFRIALMTDADERSILNIEADVLQQLSPDISLVENNVWHLNHINNTFEEPANVEFLLSIIPREGEGALETVLLDALTEKSNGVNLVECSKNFIDSLPENEYTPTQRLRLKAKLGVALSVFYPDKVFSQFDQQLQIIDWSQSETLAQSLSEIVKI